MQFRLTYEGPLPATQNSGQDGDKPSRAKLKHSIRKVFHRQLAKLWRERQFLSRLFEPVYTRPTSFVQDLVTAHAAYDFNFAPLATEQDEIDCRLDVLLLRPGMPGGVINAGDIDNRLKTLFDALRKPKNRNEVGDAKPEDGEDPFFVLLEDDSLISRVVVETDTLLEPVNGNADDVRLVVGVDVRCIGRSNYLRFL